MKPKNFPARKEARRLAAGIRNLSGEHVTAREYTDLAGIVAEARSIRTKKRRGG